MSPSTNGELEKPQPGTFVPVSDASVCATHNIAPVLTVGARSKFQFAPKCELRGRRGRVGVAPRDPAPAFDFPERRAAPVAMRPHNRFCR